MVLKVTAPKMFRKFPEEYQPRNKILWKVRDVGCNTTKIALLHRLFAENCPKDFSSAVLWRIFLKLLLLNYSHQVTFHRKSCVITHMARRPRHWLKCCFRPRVFLLPSLHLNGVLVKSCDEVVLQLSSNSIITIITIIIV